MFLVSIKIIKKIKKLINKNCYIKHISNNDLKKVIENNSLFPTSNFQLLSEMDK